MAEEAADPAVVSPVKLVTDGGDYDGMFFVGDSVRDGKLLTGNHPDIDVFFVLVSGYLVSLSHHYVSLCSPCAAAILSHCHNWKV
jgi:hypothetical protein